MPNVPKEFRDIRMAASQDPTLSKKRKHGECTAEDSCPLPRPANFILVEDSESEDSAPATATTSSKPSATTFVDMTSNYEPIPSSKASAASEQLNFACGPMPVSGSDRVERRGGRIRSQTQPIDLTMNDSDDAITLINRAFPVSDPCGARRTSCLDLLAETIEVEEDEDDNDVSRSPNKSDCKSQQEFGDIVTIDDFLSDQELKLWLKDVQLSEKVAKDAHVNVRTELSIFRGIGFTCAPEKAVELEDGSFIRIRKVTQNGTGEIFVSGLHLVRQNFLGLKMPKRRNEVVWIQQVAGRNGQHEVDEVSVSCVSKNREVVFTNQRFPQMSSRTDQDSLLDAEQDVKLGPLFCRWKMTVMSSRKKRILEESIEHLRFQDADNKVRRTKLGHEAYTRSADMRTRYDWRQIATMLGGADKVAQEVFDLDSNGETNEQQMYSFGDAFCGAGGTSRGALDAGLSIKWGFDLDEQAIASYSLNFGRGGTDCRHEAVHDFLQRVHSNPPTVDVLHISPPCQPFSHCHTVDSPVRDEINQAALFSVWHLLETLKPRVVTIEETDALMSRHREWFSALISIFLNLGYSVRWAALRCQQYGVPQTRKRLFIIASGPGEKLPSFPPPTHDNDDPALKRLVTIDDMICNIPRNAADHDDATPKGWGPKAPYLAHTQAKTLTCKGGDNYHPRGGRVFTIRELASLQTFPLYHTFAGARGITARKKQIGNAVPPVLARALFRTIIKSLKESDNVL